MHLAEHKSSLIEVFQRKMREQDPDTESLSPEAERLIELVEGNLHFIARMDMTLKQAVAIKSRLATPIGALTARYGVSKTQTIKKAGRKVLYGKSD